eukprot:3780408-Pyramimonas_sp.AAC.1
MYAATLEPDGLAARLLSPLTRPPASSTHLAKTREVGRCRSGPNSSSTWARGEVRGVRGEVKGVRGEVKGVRGEVKGVRGEVRGVRGEIKGVRGEVAEFLTPVFDRLSPEYTHDRIANPTRTLRRRLPSSTPMSDRLSPEYMNDSIVNPMRTSGCENSLLREGVSLPTKGTASSLRERAIGRA